MRTDLMAVTAAMAIGGVLSARKVAETMSCKITGMSPGEGLAANLVTAGLVTSASHLGFPVSTTHVSVGSISGLGLATGKWHPRVLMQILLAWILTLPLGAALALVFYRAGTWLA
jgi:PiT family inorganic phosphate transporter